MVSSNSAFGTKVCTRRKMVWSTMVFGTKASSMMVLSKMVSGSLVLNTMDGKMVLSRLV